MSRHPFSIDERVRWSDVDAAGIIFYGAYVRFFEIAETELFRAAGLTYGMVIDQFDTLLPRARVHAEFYAPARLDDSLRVHAYVSKVGTRSLTLQFDVVFMGGTRLIAEGSLVLVATDRDRLESKPLPEGFTDRLAPFVGGIEETRARLGISRDGT
jgi:YbgC/YbaW family acyl-CoA thioester hydrolase